MKRWMVMSCVLVMAMTPPVALAQQASPAGGLTFALERAVVLRGACVATLSIESTLAGDLDRFAMDLAVLDGAGVTVRRLRLDLAPLVAGASTRFSLPLWDGDCGGVASLRLEAMPQCRDEASGADLDCLALTTLATRGATVSGIRLQR
ncbi:MAG: hypothetical protein RIE31_11515 [Alphaproteobacteria bacterium]